MTRATWRKFANQAGRWLVTVFAVVGILVFIGDEMPSRVAIVVMLAAGWVVTWIILRRNPTYFDRKASKATA
jgi:uncharacterized membrane protein